MAKTKGKPRRRPTIVHRQSTGPLKRVQHVKPRHYMDDVKNEPLYTIEPDVDIFMMDKDRIATHIRTGGDRGALKVVKHGKIVPKMTINNPIVQNIIDNSGLAPLIDLSYKKIDSGLLSAFIERWEQRTSSFHLPHGEITITLDDVSSLLHIPITGTFFTLPTMPNTVAKACVMGLLGVSHQDACHEFKQTGGQFVRLSWLRERYWESLRTEDWEFAARAYLVHLVSSTLFAGSRQVSVQYLELFRDLSSIHTYAWGASALAFLYKQLGEASFISATNIAGYATLLQAWVYEHFPTIVNREASEHYTEAMPRACRWVPHSSTSEVLTIRRFLDTLSLEDICWAPYDDHREQWAFENISLYSGYIRCDDMVAAYLPERVMRQFGHVQGIPLPHQHVTGKPKTIDEVDQMWEEYEKHMIKDVIQLGDCSKEYLRWFLRASNPFLTLLDASATDELRGRKKLTIDRSPSPVATSDSLILLDAASPNEPGDAPNVETDEKAHAEVLDSISGEMLKTIAEHFEQILEADDLKHAKVLTRGALNFMFSECAVQVPKKRAAQV